MSNANGETSWYFHAEKKSSKPTQSKRKTNCFSKPVAKKVTAEDYMDA